MNMDLSKYEDQQVNLVFLLSQVFLVYLLYLVKYAFLI